MSTERIKKLHDGRQLYQKRFAAGELIKLNPTDKAKANPQSLRLAINAKCYECCNGISWHNRTRYCNIFDCGLWQVRPHAKDATKEECQKWQET